MFYPLSKKETIKYLVKAYKRDDDLLTTDIIIKKLGLTKKKIIMRPYNEIVINKPCIFSYNETWHYNETQNL